ncbi:MAG: GAP family protein [Actinomycetia bacterium]|nr:GAP family protein [Actinomycetes bacterium]
MWTDLAPVLLAMMISPARTLAVIILLHTPRSTTTALSYVLGMVSAMMVQGAALGAAMSIVGLAAADRSSELSAFIGALFLVGSIVLFAGAFKIATAPASGGGSLVSALERLERVDSSGAYRIGFGWIFASPKQWVFTLTAVAIIFEAQLQPLGSLANYLLFAVLVQLAYFLIIGLYVIAKDWASGVLDAMFGWTRANLKTVAIGLFSGFGLVFLLKAVTILSS